MLAGRRLGRTALRRGRPRLCQDHLRCAEDKGDERARHDVRRLHRRAPKASLEPADDDGREHADEAQQHDHDDEGRHRVLEGHQTQTHNEDVFPEAEQPVGERLRAGVGHHARAGLRDVGAAGHDAAQQRRQAGHRGRRLPERRDRNQRTSDRTDEGVQGVPDRVDPGDFVGEELDGA
ncbi:MAG: hypothetical protein MZV64_15305 [Ignavibacteriales bacterium]|nr:hypothetical protein [Ignavibacteriales bacterium]